MVDVWTKAQTISTGISLISLVAILIASFALVVDRIRLVHKKDDNLRATDRAKMQYFYTGRLGWWRTLKGGRSPILSVPRISGLIEAGDRGLWTSAALDRILEGHAEISWVPLFASIFEEVANCLEEVSVSKKKVSNTKMGVLNFKRRVTNLKRRFSSFGKNVTTPEKEGSISDIPPIRWGDQYRTFVNRIRTGKEKGNIAHKEKRWTLYESKELINCCRPLERITTDDAKSGSLLAENEKSAGHPNRGLGNMRPAWTMFRKPCIETTREELIALALVMGASIKIQSYTESLNGVGAFGLSLYATPNQGSWSLGLTQGSRIPRHAPTMGSGYTTLMAKHLACGSLPFAQNSRWVKSVYLGKPVLDAILQGRNITDISAYGGPSLELLRMLPAEKEVDAYYGHAKECDETDDSKVGLILRPSTDPSGWKSVGKWPTAVANIAFGGLVPQVHPNIAKAVQFTTLGGNWSDDRVIEELERLVDKLHNRIHSKPPEIIRHNTSATTQSNINANFPEKLACDRCLFGEHVMERCEARRNIDYVNFTVPWKHSNPRAAAAVFARYSNLLEHIVGLCDFTPPPVATEPSSTPSPAGTKSPESTLPPTGTKPPSTKSSEPTSPPPSNHPVDLLFEATSTLLCSVYIAKIRKTQSTETVPINDPVHTPNLGQTLAGIIDDSDLGAPNEKHPKPFSPEDGAFIIRCILAAWSWQVHNIELIEVVESEERDGETQSSSAGSHIAEGGETLVKNRGRIAAVDELPPVFVFG